MENNICKMFFRKSHSWVIKREERFNYNKTRTACDVISVEISYIKPNNSPHWSFHAERRIHLNTSREDISETHREPVSHDSPLARLYNKFLGMHLADITGCPMYAAQNACYHIQNGKPEWAQSMWRVDDEMFAKILKLWEQAHGGQSLPYAEAWRGLKNAVEEMNMEKLWLDSTQSLYNEFITMDFGVLIGAYQETGRDKGLFNPKRVVEIDELLGMDESKIPQAFKVSDIKTNW